VPFGVPTDGKMLYLMPNGQDSSGLAKCLDRILIADE